MHVFLTGVRQCGKSTAISRALKEINLPIYGFRTLFTNRTADDKALYMLPADYTGIPQKEQIVTQFVNGRPQVLTERFDEIGTQLLQNAQAGGIILMDECSRFEKDALRFQQSIMHRLDGDIPVLGVVRLGAEGWVENIRQHPKVKLITVTTANREDIPAEIIKWLNT